MNQTSDRIFYTGQITKEELSERLNNFLNRVIRRLNTVDESDSKDDGVA